MTDDIELDSRTDWLLRYVALTQGVTTARVLASRQQIDPEETSQKVLTSLKRLEKAGYVTSEKDGKELIWSATDAGREKHA